jgi:hypothetical protein
MEISLHKKKMPRTFRRHMVICNGTVESEACEHQDNGVITEAGVLK